MALNGFASQLNFASIMPQPAGGKRRVRASGVTEDGQRRWNENAEFSEMETTDIMIRWL
jgi:hypothetical protein